MHISTLRQTQMHYILIAEHTFLHMHWNPQYFLKCILELFSVHTVTMVFQELTVHLCFQLYKQLSSLVHSKP